MRRKKTARGFKCFEFEDVYNNSCTLQESSSASPQVWLGIDNPNPQIMASKTPEGGSGWVPYAVPEDVLLTTRMLLDTTLAKDLIKKLQKFVDTGGL